MSTAESTTHTALPGTPGKALTAAWGGLSAEEREAFLPHLLGGTSAEWLAGWLARRELPVSASTIRSYRRALSSDRSV